MRLCLRAFQRNQTSKIKTEPRAGYFLSSTDIAYASARDKAAAQRRFYLSARSPVRPLENWRQDSLRRSYASYHYGLNKSAHETARQMGYVGGLPIFFRVVGTGFAGEAARGIGRFVPLPVLRVVKAVFRLKLRWIN